MANILCEHVDDCLRIRLSSGTANALTTAVIQDLAHAVEDTNPKLALFRCLCSLSC